jgi:phosphoserine phosphatase RsbU/P
MHTSVTRQHRFREREELLDFLLEVSAATSETLDLDRLLGRIAELVKGVIPYALFAILLDDEKAGGLRIRYAIGHREEMLRSLVIPLGEGVTGAAAASGRPIVLGDARSDPRYIPSVDAVRSEAAFPMIAAGKLVGVIDLQSPELNAFTEEDASILELLSSRVAAAIYNANLHQQLERQNQTLNTLTRISQRLSSILELDELFENIAAEVRRIIPYDSFSVFLADAPQGLLRNFFSIRFDQRVRVDNIPLGSGVTGAAMESRQVIRVANTMADARYIPVHPDIRSEIAVPLIHHDRVIGAMDLESEKLAFFTEDHEAFLALLGPPVANAIANARLYEDIARRERDLQADLQAAWELQKLLVPTVAPRIEGLDLSFTFRPARKISGDLYQFYDRGEGRCLIAFGDVSGKGVAAALYGAMVNGLLATLAPRDTTPSRLLRTANHLLTRRQIEARYIALMVLAWDPAPREFHVANAGSSPVLLWHAGAVSSPRLEGLPLGMFKGAQYDETVLPVSPGDVLVLNSDGITDQPDAAGDEYGFERLSNVLRRTAGRSAKAISREILEDISRFAGDTPASDDQTLLVIKVN